jgi:hypothetical protein
MNRERKAPPVTAAGPEAPTSPPYERIGQGLARLLATTGWTVKEAFPEFAPRGAMASYDHAAKAIVLHPWIAPRARAEVLLRETVKRLTEQRTRRRGKQRLEEPRDWLVQGLVARHYGMAIDEREVSARATWQPSPGEALLAKRIVGAIEDEPPTGSD